MGLCLRMFTQQPCVPCGMLVLSTARKMSVRMQRDKGLLYNNNVSCLRTGSGLNLLANPVILKCKLWK